MHQTNNQPINQSINQSMRFAFFMSFSKRLVHGACRGSTHLNFSRSHPQVIGDMESMSSSAKKPFLDANFYTAPPQTAPPAQPTRPSTITCANKLHSAAVNNPSGEATVLVMTAIESSFLSCACRGIPGFSHADTAPLLVACEILTAIEGPMWNEIR
jgi:hypothetical protein